MKRVVKDDCLRQCVARVTGRKPSRVPHFVRKYRGRWSWHLAVWCERVGFHSILFRRVRGFCGDGEISEGVRRWIQIGFTQKGTSHAVVMECAPGERGHVVYDAGTPLKRVTRILVIIPHDGSSASAAPRAGSDGSSAPAPRTTP
jgi:hypothetical protein